MNRLLPVLLTVLAMVSIQTGAALAKGLFASIGPEGAVALRLVMAALILLAVWRPWRKPLKRRDLGVIALYGVTLGVMNLALYMALDRIPLGIAVALEFTGPLSLALIASRRRLDLVWVALAVAGLAVLLPLRGAHAVDWIGASLALLAGLCWALYIIFGQKLGDVDQGQAVSIGMVIAACVGAPLGIAHAGMDLFAPYALIIGLTIAALSSAIPYSLELYAMNRLPTAAFGVLMSLEPAIAAVSGGLILKESLTIWQWAGIGAVIVASAGAAFETKPKPELKPC
jgi:inner membrane transporter RhtA